MTNLPSCPGDCDGALMIDISCGTPPYQINWQTGLPDNTPQLINLCAGNYSVTITDSTGLTSSTIIELNDPTPVTPNPTVNNISCSGQIDGSIILNPSGGTPPYTYRWNDLAIGNTAIRDNLGEGIYIAELTDANNCTAEIEISIIEPEELRLSIETTNISCTDEGTALANVNGGTPPYNYSWSNGANTNSVTNLNFGIYSHTVTDANGCSVSQEFNISNDCCELVISMNATNILCGEVSTGEVLVNIDIEGTPPYTIEWSDPDLPQELLLTGLEVGVYTVKITDATGCQFSDEIAVLQECCPEDFTLDVMDETCTGINDGSVTIDIPNPVTPPYTFEWSTPNLPNEPQLNDLLPGTYSLTLTNGDGCSKIETFEIASSLNLEVTTTPADCDGQGGTATASADGFFLNFFWSNGGSGASQSDLAVGDYSVTVYNLFGGCRSAADFRIEEDPACPDNFVVAPNNLQLAQPKQPTLSMQLSPNPAVDRGFIRYALEEATAVTLEIYDLQGRVVRSLERAQQRSAGEHQLQVELSDLEAGTYLVRLETLSGIKTITPWVKMR